MLEIRINSYGKDKLKNLASYEKLQRYPVIYKWHERNSIEPRKYTLYFAVPDDRGNTFTIPYKWCEDVTDVGEPSDMVLELNSMALEQLSKVGNFESKGTYLYPIIHIWHDLTPSKDQTNKKRFDLWFAILDRSRKIFIVQSTWGRILLLDEEANMMYPFDSLKP